MDCVVKSVNVVLVEDHMITDRSHDLGDTQQHVEQMVQKMMNNLDSIHTAGLVIDIVGVDILYLHCLLLAVAK